MKRYKEQGCGMANNDIVPGFDDDKDESLKILLHKINDVPGCLMLTLVGYIDTNNSYSFQKRVQKAIEAGYPKLIFHCGGLNYVSSMGIDSFTSFIKTLKPQGGNLVMLDIQSKVYEVFQLLGFSQIFNIMNNIEDSISFLNTDKPLEESSVFPIVVSCPICYKNLKAVRAGRFRCSECKNILDINETAQVILG